ncbi:MAG: Fur family transcriptional regulator [Phycisphaerales bacterium JB039]
MTHSTCAIFNQHGLRRTRQRALVYEALASTRSHPTADELYERLRTSEAGLSLATVYNALEAFLAAGLCRRIPSPTTSGSCRYDACVEDHAHVIMPDGRAMDVPADVGDELLERLNDQEIIGAIEQRLGVRITGFSVRLLAENAESQTH